MNKQTKNYISLCLIIIGFIIGMLFMWISFVFDINGTATNNGLVKDYELERCEAQLPQNVLAYNCEGNLHQIIVDKNNKSLYDYNIEKGCIIYPLK